MLEINSVMCSLFFRSWLLAYGFPIFVGWAEAERILQMPDHLRGKSKLTGMLIPQRGVIEGLNTSECHLRNL